MSRPKLVLLCSFCNRRATCAIPQVDWRGRPTASDLCCRRCAERQYGTENTVDLPRAVTDPEAQTEGVRHGA